MRDTKEIKIIDYILKLTDYFGKAAFTGENREREKTVKA